MGRPTVSKPELLVDGSDETFRGFVHAFLAFSARLNDIRAGFGAVIGLTGIAYTTLISVGYLQRDKGVGVAALAGHLHLSGAFVTIEVNKLVAGGLVEKRVNDDDRRRVLLTLTAAGRRKLDELAEVQSPVNDALFDCLSRADFRHLNGKLDELVTCADTARALQGQLTTASRGEAHQPLTPARSSIARRSGGVPPPVLS